MQPRPQHQPTPRPSYAWDIPARVIGALLLIPAIFLAVRSLVVPTVETIRTSFHSQTLISESGSEGVGFDNYDRLLDDLWSPLWFSLLLVTGPILVAVVVAPLLSAAFDRAGGWGRVTARIVLSLTLVVFSPVALALAWQRALGNDDPPPLSDADKAGITMATSVWMMTFGVACAVGVMLFLPAFRAREQGRSMWPPMFAIAGVTVLGLLAIGLQQFTIPFVMTNFGPADETMTPVGVMYATAFGRQDAGAGAAVASVLLALLGLLGVAAVLIVILTRLRVSLLPFRQRRPMAAGVVGPVPPGAGPASPATGPAGHGAPTTDRLPMPPQAPTPTASTQAPTPPMPPASAPPARPNPGAIAIAVVVLIAVAAVTVLNLRPWLDALSGDAPTLPTDPQSRTWTSAIGGTLVSVGAAYLAALGIGGLRPLGRHSELLLLPFAPWLFVGIAPLSIEFFMSLNEKGDIDTESALRPQILVSMVALVVLTILCKGQSERWRREVAAGAHPGGTFFLTVVLPTLPLAGLLAMAIVFVHEQDLLWPALVAISPENWTTPLGLVQANLASLATEFSVAPATPLLAVVVGFVVLVAAQVLYLDRMVAATGGDADELTSEPDTGAGMQQPYAGSAASTQTPSPTLASPSMPPGPAGTRSGDA
jgi:ABC-type sugar transport system permease subunit